MHLVNNFDFDNGTDLTVLEEEETVVAFGDMNQSGDKVSDEQYTTARAMIMINYVVIDHYIFKRCIDHFYSPSTFGFLLLCQPVVAMFLTRGHIFGYMSIL